MTPPIGEALTAAEAAVVRIFNLGYSHRGEFNPKREADAIAALLASVQDDDKLRIAREALERVRDQLWDRPVRSDVTLCRNIVRQALAALNTPQAKREGEAS